MKKTLRKPARGSNFFHAHSHSQFSPLDAMAKVPLMVETAVKHKQPALALTDHGLGGGWVQLYKSCKAQGILPYPGFEGYLLDPAFEGNLEDAKVDTRRYHFCLLALDEKGYQGLVKFISLAHTRPRFNKFPRHSLSDLASFGQTYGKHVALLTGCYFGYVQQTIVARGEDDGQRVVKAMAQWFPHLYVEVQNHSSDANEFSDDVMCKQLFNIAGSLSLPVVATQDSHYLLKEHRQAHDLMKQMVYGSPEDAFPGDGFHLSSTAWVRDHYTAKQWAEVEAGFADLLSHNKVKITPLDKFVVDVPHVSKKPMRDLRRIVGKAHEEYMQRLKPPPRKRKRYDEALADQLSVIEDLHMAAYFLVWYRFVRWCRKRKIAIEARGSANGSYVCYLLGVTQVDPIEWNCDPERFLSRDRIKPPDIDMDIEDIRRGEALHYFFRQYPGSVQIGTYNCVAPGSRVLTADLEWVPVETVAVGDELVAFDEKVNGYIHRSGQQSCYRTAVVTANDKTVQRSSRIVTDLGEVVASNNHKWVVVKPARSGGNRTWVETGDLQVGDQIMYLSEPWEQEDSWESGWLAGLMDGEGYVTPGADATRRIVVVQADGPVADKFELLMKERGYRIESHLKTGRLAHHQDIWQMVVAGGLPETLRALGSLRPERLLSNAGHFWEGRRTYGKIKGRVATVQRVEDVGRRTVYAIGTDTHTLMVEGMFSHNSLGITVNKEGVATGSVFRTWQQWKRRVCEEKAIAKHQKAEQKTGAKFRKGDAITEGKREFARRFGWMQSVDDVRRYSEEEYIGLKMISDMNSVRKSYGVHAGGVLLPGEHLKIEDWIPTMLVASSDTRCSMFDMDDVEEFGILKNDLLGQTSLGVMRICQELIGRPDPTDFQWMPLDDPKALRLLRDGRTDTGVFHFEGWTKSRGGKELGVKSVRDAILVQALYMPGCMDVAPGQKVSMKDLYLRRRRNPDQRDVDYIHPAFEKALAPTYGCVVFQEQVIDIMRGLGMDIASINKFFKVVKDSGKGAVARNQQRMQEVRQQFDDICDQNGIDSDEAWAQTASFVAYGFNRNHATAYGLRSYRTAYLKAHHALEYMTALLIAWAGTDKEKVYAREARRVGFPVRPPSIMRPSVTWSMDKRRGAIRKGLISVAGIGAPTAELIVAQAPYASLYDFCARVDQSKVTGTKPFLETGRTDVGILGKLMDAGVMEDLPIGDPPPKKRLVKPPQHQPRSLKKTAT